MSTENVNVVYTADVQQYQTSLAEAMALTDRYATSANNLAGAIGKVGVGFARFTTGNPLSEKLALAPATQQAAAYEQQLSLLSARAKVAGQDLGGLQRNVMALSRAFPVGMGQAVQQFEAIQRAGKSGDELNKVTIAMTKLGAATGEMSTRLTESQTQFARTFDKFDSKNIDALNDSVTTMSSTFGSSASAMLDFGKAIAPISKQVGMAATDVLGFATAFSRAGEDGYRAANVFNKMVGDMERSARTGSPQVRAYAEALGVTISQFRTMAQENPTEVMTSFLETVKDSGRDGIRILEDLGLDGVRAMKSIQAVAGQGGIRESVETARQSYGSGSTEIAAKEAFGGLSDSMNQTKESLNQLIAAGGQPYLKMMTGIIDKTNDGVSALASFAASPAIQKIIEVGFLVGAGASVAGTATTGLFGLAAGKSLMTTKGIGGALGGAATALTGSRLGQFASAHRGGLIAAGGAGAVLGGMSGNTGLQIAGLGALLLPSLMSGQGRLNRAMRGVSAGLVEGYAGHTDTALSRFRDIRRGEGMRGGWGWRAGRRLDLWTLGVHGADARAMMPENVSPYPRAFPITSAGGVQQFSQQREMLRQQQAGSRALWARRMAAAPARAGLLGAQAVGGASRMAFGNPYALGLVAAGGLGFAAYKSAQSTQKEEAAPSLIQKVGEAAGIAAKGLEEMNEGLEKVTSAATTTYEAMQVNATEMNLIRQKEYEAAWKPSPERSNVQLGAQLRATAGNQSPELQNRMVMDLASQVGRTRAEEIARMALGEEGMYGEMSPFDAASEFAETRRNRTWHTTVGSGLFNRYFGKAEVIGTYKSAAEGERARAQQIAATQGETAAAQFQLGKLNQAFEDMGEMEVSDLTGGETFLGGLFTAGLTPLMGPAAPSGSRWLSDRIPWMDKFGPNQTRLRDPERIKQQLYGAGMSEDLANELIGGYYGTTGSRGAVNTGDFNDFEEYARSTEMGAAFFNDLENQEKDAMGAIERIVNEGGSFTGSDALLSAIKKASDNEMTLRDVLKEYDKNEQVLAKSLEVGYGNLTTEEQGILDNRGKYLQSDFALNAEQAAAARTMLEPENAAQQTMTNMVALTNAIRNLGEGSQSAANQIEMAISGLVGIQKGTVAQGQLPPEAVGQATRDYQQTKAGIQMMTGGQFGTATGQKMVADYARQFLAGTGIQVDEQGLPVLEFDENNEPVLADDETVAGLQAEAVGDVLEQWQANQQRKASFSRAAAQRQLGIRYQQQSYGRQAGYARTDMGISQGRARASFARQEGYSREDMAISQGRARQDFQLQESRSWTDFYISRSRQVADFHKSMNRQEVDFYRSRRNMLEDYNKSISRSQEDFALSMERNAERTARSMLEPFRRLGTSRVWSAGGLAANLEEQNRAVEEQLKVLDDLKARGLSQDTIDLLGLAEAGNARQAINLGTMSDEELAALNAATGTRMGLGEEVAEEQVGTRQSREDFAKQLMRQAEDLQVTLSRQDEEFRISRSRAWEDFHLSMARQREDFTKSMARAREDFNKSLSRQSADFERSLARQLKEMNISLAQQEEDLTRSLSRQWTEMLITNEQSLEMLRLQYSEMTFTDADEMQQTFANAWNGAFQDYDKFMTSTVEGTTTEFTNLTGAAVDDMTTSSDSSMSLTSKAAQAGMSGVEDVLGSVEDAADKSKVAAVRAAAQVAAHLTQMIDKLKTYSTRALNTIRLFGSAQVKLLADSVKNSGNAIRANMGKFAWMLEADGNAISNNKKEIVVKIDKESFKSTFGSLDFSGAQGGGQGGGIPASYTGTANQLFVTGGKGYVSQPYGKKNSRYALGYHTGLDIAAAGGTPIYSTVDGKVVSSGYDRSYGNNVVIDDDDSGVRLLFAHMSQRIARASQNVRRGSLIGKVGTTGNSTGNHLHLEARVRPWTYGNDVSPMPYLEYGGLAMRPGYAMVAERSPEAIIPLDGKGAQFMSDVLGRYMGAKNMPESRIAGHSISHTTNMTSNHYDSSVHAGTITVQANDPDALYEGVRRKMARNRLASRV